MHRLVPANIPNFPTSYFQNSFILHVLTNGLPSSSVGTPNDREVSDLETWLWNTDEVSITLSLYIIIDQVNSN